MSNPPRFRLAVAQDISALLDIEQACFTADALSRRSFQRFTKSGSHQLLIMQQGEEIIGYGLVLFRVGTSLARLYSIAILPQYQGQGYSRPLLAALEEIAATQQCAFIRLEVRIDNPVAIKLYQSLRYKAFGHIDGYYEDGCTAVRMEKRLGRHLASSQHIPYYQQTTDFTCGPATLMMALKQLNPQFDMTRREELRLWREATTIYMTSGHGGCSPYGLALSAWRRDLQVNLYVNQEGPLFIDSVRNPEKKEVLQLVHADFLDQIQNTDIQLHYQAMTPDRLQQWLSKGAVMLALISTWSFNRNQAPHWVFVYAADHDFVYLNDPDTDDDPWLSETDYMQVPIPIKSFIRIACFGRSRLRSFVVLQQKS